MTILCVGDLHIQKRNLLLFKKFSLTFFEYIKTQPDIDTIVILGDILHTMSIINTHCLNTAITFFKQLDTLDKKIFILVGNHDFIGPNEFMSKNHWMNSISEFNPKNIVIVDTVIRYKNHIYMPYVPPGRFKEALSKTDLKDVHYIFCHQEFLGAMYEFGNVKSDHGDEWDNDIVVVSGHIHKRQWLKNIYYTGTPYQTRFNEDPDKTIALIDGKDIREISLDLPKMITVYTTIKDAATIKFNTDNLYKVIIKVESTAQSQNFLKTALYRQLFKNASIVFEYPKTSNNIVTVNTSEPKNFTTILYDKIKNNKNMEYLFTKCL
jgi:DNA repair exonuclease SbcCD nuclease subunit